MSTNDDWIMSYDLGMAHSAKWATALYFLVIIYVVNYMMFGFIMAILLENFQKFLEEDEGEQHQNELDAMNEGLRSSQPLHVTAPEEILEIVSPKGVSKLLDVKHQIEEVVRKFLKGKKYPLCR
jgi:hypothetical protein